MSASTPRLRFPGFQDDWNENRLGSFFTSSRAKGKDGMPTLSVTLTRGLINREEIERKTETNLAAHEHLLVRTGDIAYNMMRMWQGAFGRSDREGIVSPAYVVLRPQNSVDSQYFEYAFRRPRSIYLFWAYSYGLTNDRLRLYANDCLRIPFSAPTLPEQEKIAAFLTSVDGRIAQLIEKKALLESYKKGVMQQIFSRELRFIDDDGNEFPEWGEKKFTDIFKTTSSRGYQIQSSQILSDGNFRVVDQGKNKVAGYSNDFSKVMKQLPVIVYGDHTTIVKYIDFKFIVGADGTQILVKRNTSDDLKFLFYSLVQNNVPQEGYKRHFCILKQISLQLPSLPEQTKIAAFLTALDRKIEVVSTQIALTRTFKKGLLQQMFV